MDPTKKPNFITQIIDADNAAGTYEGRVVTRFPPEPNGYLHIGHAKSICLNFGLGQAYGGRTHLRFDDTNPVAEEQEYVDAIKNDVQWLGFDWGEHLYFASDFFEQMYDCAVTLVKAGKAYVDSSSVEDIRRMRGSLTEAGEESPYRDRSVEENLDLLARMRAGEFENGAHVLRAKIDMASPNMLMRDPLLYRIRHATHHRTGDDWCIYPMYDFAHCLEDAFEGVTHSICTLEFENNRELYDWVIANTEVPNKPKQIEFARLNLGHVVMSKRKLLQLVKEERVSGWDDPRMPTVAGIRRRGVPAEAVRRLAELVGVAKTNSLVDIDKFDYCVRDTLNHEAPRVLCVARPLKITLTNWAGPTEQLEADYWPYDVPREGTRALPMSGTLFIERDDFAKEPPKKWRRLAPGTEVRLRHSYVIRCDEVIEDESGEVIELRCSYDPSTLQANPEGRKVSGTLHWVSADDALPCELRLYDRLFSVEQPGADPDADPLDFLNPGSLVRIEGARVEPSVAGDPTDTRYQFERRGYFWRDPVDSAPDALVFNRIVPLRDSWKKAQAKSEGGEQKREKRSTQGRSVQSTKAKKLSAGEQKARERERARAEDPELVTRRTRYAEELGLSAEEADVLSGSRELSDFFDAATASYAEAASVAKWVLNEVLRELKDRSPSELPFGGEAIGALARIVDAGTISTTAGKEVFAVLLAEGGDPAAIVEAKGLKQVSDSSALAPIIDQVIADNAAQAEAYRGGKTQLLGFFIGAVMRASGGKADPGAVRSLLTEKLGG